MAKTVNDDYPGNSKPMTDEQLKAIATANYHSKGPNESTDKSTKNEKQPETQVYQFPTEIIELPSKGKLYPKGHPLSNGTVEMKYMSAKEEDILTNQSFIRQGVVLDKLFKSLIVTPVEYNDLLLCDKNAIMIAARVLGYGKDYKINLKNPNTGEDIEQNVDLTQLKERDIDWSLLEEGKNAFEFELPACKRTVTLQLLTQRESAQIDKETKALQKLKKSAGTTTTLKHVITSIDGDTDKQKIRHFVEGNLLAIDARAIRQYLNKITPDIDLSVEVLDESTGDTFRSQINVGLDFFWPDLQV